jgi:choline dehydrogenase-like flavoprotein
VRGLHVLGASVFPTSGYANPTLTIVALALRLAGHLHQTRRQQ